MLFWQAITDALIEDLSSFFHLEAPIHHVFILIRHSQLKPSVLGWAMSWVSRKVHEA